jgi:DNA-binding PadR family transcriptional regulator
MTIYELNAAFKQGLSLIYAASYGNLQYAVKKLLNEKFIEFKEAVENGRNKKIYHVTENGMQSFFGWMESEIPVTKLETTMLSKVFFLGLIKNSEKRVEIVMEMISKAEQVEKGLLQMNEELGRLNLPVEAMEIAQFQFKTLDYGIMAHGAGKRWLYELLDEIKKE